MNVLAKNSNQLFKFRAAHLDLKGTPPKPKKLIELLYIFAAAGYNVILVEWENMFPWDTDEQFKISTAYNVDTLEIFYKTAKELDLEIIPLVQTLGHMETFLSPTKYKHLREQHDCSDVLNPLAEGSQEFVQSILEEMIQKTPNIKHIHIGGDEAWTFGTHPDTKQFVKKNGKAKLFLHHILPMLEMINSKGIRPIIWHDMITDYDDEHLSCLKDKADVAIWGYCDSPYNTKLNYNIKIIEKFSKLGFNIWGSTAYKGADGSTRDVPDFHKRHSNTVGWIEAGKTHEFKGMIATGWSRYTSLCPQCEPIYGALDILFHIGMLLNNCIPSENSLKDSHDAIEKIPQASLFKSTNSALARIAAARKIAWESLWWITEQITIEQYDSRFKSSKFSFSLINSMTPMLDDVENACNQSREILLKSIDEIWVDEYLNARIQSLHYALDKLKTEAKRTENDNKNLQLKQTV